ncbi:hypothetical protein [Rugamonas aquatica]|uniref:hypothetical protein n=1 Tax=Rugamonas aquatica TaxID=2743357 RepID=UPI001F1F5349|nr:hypothetical protein [Rugamonas aquatica]
MPEAGERYAAWDRKSQSNRVGIGISIALHLIGVLYYFLAPAPERKHAAPPKGGVMVYIAPLPEKKNPNKPQPKKTEVAKASKPPPPKQVATRDTPAAIRPKLETYVPPVQATMTPPPEQDMSEMIAKRRAAREANNPQPAPPAPAESDAERSLRIAKANIAGAQGRSGGADKDDTGGIFSVDKSYHSADVKFRGWNTNFKRNWTQQLHVEQGAEPDIETAVVKEMIKVIRKEKTGDFPWESRRLGKVVIMSARKEDEKDLIAFLLKEMFPEYTRGASR